MRGRVVDCGAARDLDLDEGGRKRTLLTWEVAPVEMKTPKGRYGWWRRRQMARFFVAYYLSSQPVCTPPSWTSDA